MLLTGYLSLLIMYFTYVAVRSYDLFSSVTVCECSETHISDKFDKFFLKQSKTFAEQNMAHIIWGKFKLYLSINLDVNLVPLSVASNQRRGFLEILRLAAAECGTRLTSRSISSYGFRVYKSTLFSLFRGKFFKA